MSVFSLLVLAVGLSMDAFAVSLCQGLAMPRVRLRDSLWVGLWFGGFQGLMPLLGCLLGQRFAQYITGVDHWVAFGLLAALGLSMLWQGIRGEEESVSPSLAVGKMFLLALATSIDAMAAGLTFAFLDMEPLLPCLCIAAVTFLFSAVSLQLGQRWGKKLESRAELLGGGILLALGIKILLEHLLA